jgi:hypothetical protein
MLSGMLAGTVIPERQIGEIASRLSCYMAFRLTWMEARSNVETFDLRWMFSFIFYLFIIDSTDKLVRGDVYRMNQIFRGWTDGLTRVSDMGDREPYGSIWRVDSHLDTHDTSPASVLLGSLIAGSLAELMGIMGDDGRHWVPVRATR